MRKQRNMAEMKEQKKPPEEPNKMDIRNLSDAEFRILVIRICVIRIFPEYLYSGN